MVTNSNVSQCRCEISHISSTSVKIFGRATIKLLPQTWSEGLFHTGIVISYVKLYLSVYFTAHDRAGYR
jgi:hypothetical protein